MFLDVAAIIISILALMGIVLVYLLKRSNDRLARKEEITRATKFEKRIAELENKSFYASSKKSAQEHDLADLKRRVGTLEDNMDVLTRK